MLVRGKKTVVVQRRFVVWYYSSLTLNNDLLGGVYKCQHYQRMTTEEFQTASFVELGIVTGIDRHRWSRYLSGKVSITEKLLSRIAPRLGMTPDELLTAILQRRQK